MAGYEKLSQEYAEEGISVFAASADGLEHAREVQEELGFPIGYGVGRALAESIGAWWDDDRGIIQPAEFVLSRDGKVVSATYSSGPIGRVDAADVLKLVAFLKSRAQKS